MKRALVAALLSALATAAVLATVGFGANSTATTASKKKSSHSSQATQSGPPKTLKQVYDEQQTRRAAQDKKLADALGVSVDDLTKAQETVVDGFEQLPHALNMLFDGENVGKLVVQL